MACVVEKLRTSHDLIKYHIIDGSLHEFIYVFNNFTNKVKLFFTLNPKMSKYPISFPFTAPLVSVNCTAKCEYKRQVVLRPWVCKYFIGSNTHRPSLDTGRL